MNVRGTRPICGGPGQSRRQLPSSSARGSAESGEDATECHSARLRQALAPAASIEITGRWPAISYGQTSLMLRTRPPGCRSGCSGHALACPPASLGRTVPARHPARRGALRCALDDCAGDDAVRDWPGDPDGDRRPRQPLACDLDVDPARPRDAAGLRWGDASPLLGLQLAAGPLSADSGCRSPRSAFGAGGARRALDRRGRRHGVERRDPGGGVRSISPLDSRARSSPTSWLRSSCSPRQ